MIITPSMYKHMRILSALHIEKFIKLNLIMYLQIKII